MFTRSQQAILNQLIAGRKTLSELAQALGSTKPALIKQLAELEQKKLVEKRIEKTLIGREAAYELKRFTSFFSLDSSRAIRIETGEEFDTAFFLLEQIKEEEFKSDLHILLKALLRKLSRDDFILLFGSVAQGRGTWKSDIDVAVLSSRGAEWKKQVEEIIAEASQKAKHQIKPKFVDFTVFENSESQLIQEIKDAGMVLFGDLFRSEVWKELKRYRNIST